MTRKNITTYSAKLTGNTFLFFEMRIVAGLKKDGFSDKEIKDKVTTDNLFLYKTGKSILKRLREVLKRLNCLDDTLLSMFVNSESDTAKLITLYTILKSDLLFYEFMEEVILDKYTSRQKNIEQSDFKQFFQFKAEQSDIVSTWTENTVKELIRVYKSILKEAGLLKDSMELKSSLMPSVLSDYLIEKGEENYVRVMSGI
jgi:hypothetical protein